MNDPFQDMPELRKDPVIGRWVIMAHKRGFSPSAMKKAESGGDASFDPFAPGNEFYTPPEVMAFRPQGSKPNSPGWWIRVVPNKFPILEPVGEAAGRGEGIYDKIVGIGRHEIVIETPERGTAMADLPQKQLEEIIWAWRERTRVLAGDARFEYVLIYKNHGESAGASIEHPHSQIIALPIIPKRVQEEIEGARVYHQWKRRCVFCDIVYQELNDNKRLLVNSDHFLAFHPYASRFPFEICITPKEHRCQLIDIAEHEVRDLAKNLGQTLKMLKTALNDPPYSFVIHTAPVRDADCRGHYHWHIEIIPKLSHIAGFEWGTGFYVNPIPPENARDYIVEEVERYESALLANPSAALP